MFKYILKRLSVAIPTILLLIIISLWPGSLLGFLLYGSWQLQPDIIENPYGTTINHFISYFYVSTLGLYLYLRSEYFQKLFYVWKEQSDLKDTINIIGGVKEWQL